MPKHPARPGRTPDVTERTTRPGSGQDASREFDESLGGALGRSRWLLLPSRALCGPIPGCGACLPLACPGGGGRGPFEVWSASDSSALWYVSFAICVAADTKPTKAPMNRTHSKLQTSI